MTFKSLYKGIIFQLLFFSALFGITGFSLAQETGPGQLEESVDTSYRVFGGNLFTGTFAQQSFSGFNPNYRINVGDTLYLQVWGAVEFEGEQQVDPQGNIFIPQVGPVRVLGTPNGELNNVIENAVSRVYTNNVFIYTSLVEAQPVKVFVTGNVIKPGLYPGLSSDSILSYLDRAGGIDPQRGSYLDVRLKRDNETVKVYNLYDFLLEGTIDSIQLHEGDVLVVGSRQSVVQFDGLVENPYQIEFRDSRIPLANALEIVDPLPQATHISIERNSGITREVEYMEIGLALESEITLLAGDMVSLVADKTQSTIGIMVEGEHLGQAQYVLPYGSRLGDLIPLLKASELSDLDSIQLFRRSLATQQKRALEQSLRGLEAQVLSARNNTIQEAQLRTQEAELILQFVERARQIQPRGQVIIGNTNSAQDLVLENGDRLVIPATSNLISVSGEILFPNATVYGEDKSALDYINQAGGFTQRADDTRVIIRRPSGAVTELAGRDLKRSGNKYIQSGDEILVMPAVDTKQMQYTTDIIQIIYQLALSAGVVLSI
ncbi:MAG: polysaccharide biosynthesis/export family protein [Pseudomonadales bacterium]